MFAFSIWAQILFPIASTAPLVFGIFRVRHTYSIAGLFLLALIVSIIQLLAIILATFLTIGGSAIAAMWSMLRQGGFVILITFIASGLASFLSVLAILGACYAAFADQRTA